MTSDAQVRSSGPADSRMREVIGVRMLLRRSVQSGELSRRQFRQLLQQPAQMEQIASYAMDVLRFHGEQPEQLLLADNVQAADSTPRHPFLAALWAHRKEILAFVAAILTAIPATAGIGAGLGAAAGALPLQAGARATESGSKPQQGCGPGVPGGLPFAVDNPVEFQRLCRRLRQLLDSLETAAAG